MKNMLSVLAGRSFRASKMRNLIAVLAIMLTAILFTTVTTIGMGVSGDTVRNYISLTNLVPELMQMVDEKKIALSPVY